MSIQLQLTLQNETIILRPLEEHDFDCLYELGSDPAVWEQHPNPDRWKVDVFQNYFNGAMESKGAFLIIEAPTGKVAGCTRLYDYKETDNSIFIGYTFVGREYWGKGLNPAAKSLLLHHAFTFVDTVYFHIGAGNIRSQIAIGRIGATKIGEEAVAYYGEASKLNYVYCITRQQWLQQASTAVSNT